MLTAEQQLRRENNDLRLKLKAKREELETVMATFQEDMRALTNAIRVTEIRTAHDMLTMRHHIHATVDEHLLEHVRIVGGRTEFLKVLCNACCDRFREQVLSMLIRIDMNRG